MAKGNKKHKNGPGETGYEAQLWQMADALRGSMDAAEYKHVVLGRYAAICRVQRVMRPYVEVLVG